MRKIKNGLLLAALCTVSVYSQGISVTAPKITVTAPTITVPAAVVPAVAVPVAVVPAVAVPTDPATPAAEAPTPPAPEPEKQAEPALPASEAPKPPAPEPEKQVVTVPIPVPPVAVIEPSNVKFHLGLRAGIGASALRGHVALKVASYENINQLVPVELMPALSLGLGLAFAIEINRVLTIAPEPQYTLYRANGATRVKSDGIPYQEEAGISLHSFELPILARFSFGTLYAELGPQVGYNSEARSYKNDDSRKIGTNPFAFSPALGFGASVSETLIGIRGCYGLFEYAKNTKGYPWAVQVSVTKFFF